jgi:PAS domain S-box-containing protein
MLDAARVLSTFKDPVALLLGRPELIDILPIAVYACDAEGRLCWFNARAAELWGRVPRVGDDTELFCGSFKLYDLGGTLIRREETPMAAVLRTGDPVHDREALVERPDGSKIFAMVHIDPVRAADGRLLGAINCFHDTTELHRMKTEIAEGGAMLHQVLDLLPAAIYTIDAQGRITYFNKAAVELAGREPMLGHDEWCVTWQLYTPDGAPLAPADCPMAVALKEDRPIRGVEAVAERPDGSRRPFLPFPTPLHDLSGKVVGAVNMLLDISERKDAETQQKLLMAELNHRVKNNMMMLHALLTGSRRETSNPDAQAILGEAAQRVGAMAAAQQVLYGAADPHGFAVDRFVDALGLSLQQAAGTRAKIRTRTDSGILTNDAAMPIALMLNELVTNAVKHAASADRDLAIDVGLLRHENGWRFEVRDNGPGFDAGPSKRKASGLGLVRGLAAQLGGRLQVIRDEGALCRIDFPDRQARQFECIAPVSAHLR